jgi:hypothetical protein
MAGVVRELLPASSLSEGFDVVIGVEEEVVVEAASEDGCGGESKELSNGEAEVASIGGDQWSTRMGSEDSILDPCPLATE